MKRLIITFIFFTVAGMLWFISGSQKLDKDKYLNQNILDMSRPLDVTIDIEFLRELKPAYE
ncbi:MAG: hypothetical protein KatS3mg101_0008 [Patescibacteria group bacterium]|nr:MAG: hypothetical protein KatS3mg101_0008 [Patescibacteria group bacterium]